MIAGVRDSISEAGYGLAACVQEHIEPVFTPRSLWPGSDVEIANLSEARDTRLLQELLNSATTVLDAGCRYGLPLSYGYASP